MDEKPFSSLLALAFERGALLRLTASKPSDADLPIRQSGRMAKHGDDVFLTVESVLTGGRVIHRHYKADALSSLLDEWYASYMQIQLHTASGDALYLRSRKGKVTLTGVEKLRRALDSDTKREVTEDLDRKKVHLLSGKEPFLIALGVSSPDGRVYDKKQAKFRQINRFLEHVRDILPALPEEGELTVYDLCCGKSYLSFALYHYLTVTCARKVAMLCVDLKKNVIDECGAIASGLGFDGMEFRCDDVRRVPCDKTPDLLVSLHACDIATDIVLNTGIKLGARVILSTPCCHRALNNNLACEPLMFAARHPQLRTKLCEALTDALRLLRLEKNGYTVTALELTDPDDTPKNTLLRAVLPPNASKTTARAKRAACEYEAALLLLLGEKGHPERIDGSAID